MARFQYIDAAKGLAIILVVFGHAIAREIPPQGAYYSIAKQIVYLFHMPFFVFITGLTYGFSVQRATSFGDWWGGFSRRARRLVLAYLLLGLLVFFGKQGVALVQPVDNPVTGWYDLVNLVLFPEISFAAFLWYIYVMVVFYAVTPWLLLLSGNRVWPLIVLGAVFLLLPSASFLAWGEIIHLFFFFAFGIFAARQHDQFMQLLGKAMWPGILAFCLMLFLSPTDGDWLAFLTAVFSIIGLLALLLRLGHRADFLAWVGRYSSTQFSLGSPRWWC
jgi:fucose 4-O-acetylase-like acetyltransferase